MPPRRSSSEGTGRPAAPFSIAGQTVPPGGRLRLRLPVARRYTHTDVFVPCEVLHGRLPGPSLFVCAAIHGDEINGVEIIRRLLARPLLRRLRGTLIAVPVVNVYGFIDRTRNLPDRRDLNRSFPGSAGGSLASRLAHRFVTDVVGNATHGIDLHTGARHRSNLPQVRACLDQEETAGLARAFGAPVVLDANLRDGSLRQEVLERNIPMLVYEGGEALRFDEIAIRAGLRGVQRVMHALGMLPAPPRGPAPREPFVARSSTWVRAPSSGILRTAIELGASVERGQVLGVLSDPLGGDASEILSPCSGVVVGQVTLPLANEGDALFHVAAFGRKESVAGVAETLLEELYEPGPF